MNRPQNASQSKLSDETKTDVQCHTIVLSGSDDDDMMMIISIIIIK